MIGFKTEHIGLRVIVGKVFADLKIAKNTCIYELKTDAGLMDYAFTTFENTGNMQELKCSDFELYLHLLAWAMFEQGVLTAYLTLKYGRPLLDVLKEDIQREMETYYSKEYIHRTLELLNSSTNKVAEAKLVEFIKEYIKRVEGDDFIELYNHDHLEWFATMAFYAGNSVYIQLQGDNERFFPVNWCFACF